MTSQDVVAKVTVELDDIAQRVLPRVFQRLDSKNGPLKIENIGPIVARSYPEEWAADREAALTRALRHAITYLSGNLGSISAQEFMLRLFNLDGAPDLPDVKPLDLSLAVGKKYSYLRESAINAAKFRHWSPSEQKDQIAPVRARLAEILVNPSFPNIPRATPVAEARPAEQSSPGHTQLVASIATRLRAHDNQPFVQRETYAYSFQQLIDQDHRCIIFNGGRGNGKSRLALELVARQPEALETGIFLQANSAEMLSRELRAMFSARGVQESDLFEGFAALVSAADAPSYVILDNLEHPGLLDDLLPSSYRSIIVVTASQRIPTHVSGTLDVTPMTEDEATELATELLPDLEPSEAEKVARALGGRPLAIVHTCGYILGSDLVTVEEFLQDLKIDAASTLETAELAAEETLTAIYIRILRQLGDLQADKNAPVRDLLELISCLAPDDIPSSLLRDSLSPTDEEGIAPTTFNKAVLGLQSRFLITVSEGQFAIHPLTQEILRALLRREDKEQARCLELHRPVQQMLRGETRSRFVSDEITEVLPHICRIVLGLRACEVAVFSQVELGRTLAVIWRGLGQVREKRDYLDTAVEELSDFMLAVVERFFREDEPGQILFDDARPLIREFIPSMYAGGAIDGETYYEQMAAVLNVTDPDQEDQYLRLPPYELLEFCNAALADNQIVGVIAVLRSQEERVRHESDDPTLLGDYKTLEGAALARVAEWDAGERALRDGIALYATATDSLLATRGRVRALLWLGELLLLSGQKDKIDDLMTQVGLFVDEAEALLERDVLSAAFINHYLARVMAADYLSSYYEWCQDRHYSISELAERMSSDEIGRFAYRSTAMISDAAEVLNRQDDTREEYETGNYIRESHNLAYDHVLISGLMTPQRMEEVLAHYEHGNELASDPLLRIRLEVARFKVLAMHNVDTACDLSRDRLSDCVDLLEGAQAAYWNTEFLATYCILMIRGGMPNVVDVIAQLESNYTAISRVDRWDHFREAVDALQKDDPYRFKREFSYMLTF